MPTARPFLFEGSQAGCFHVVSRLIERRYLLDDEGKELFLKMVRAYEDLLEVEVLTFCIMSQAIYQVICNCQPSAPPFDIETFEPIEPPWQAIRVWIPADDDESPTDTPELWDQNTATGWKAPEIDLGDGRTLVLEYT